jgi:3-oxoadipate enol-lactonase
VLDTLATGPVTAVGYSMGGPIAMLLARARPDLVGGLVLCATAPAWSGRDFDRLWRVMGPMRVVISLAPFGFWTTMMRLNGMAGDPAAAWLLGELGRGAPAMLAEAGRELGRFDGRPWLAELRMPSAVVVTSRDTSVPPARQHALAEALGAASFDVTGDHLVAGEPDGPFTPGLLAAIAHVRSLAADRTGGST